MNIDYAKQIEQNAEEVFNVMAPRTTSNDMRRLKLAFQFALDAHSHQKRKTGEPYILHPIAVAKIAAEELNLDVNSVIAAFLHDVVEDTKHTSNEIEELFGSDVSFLVKAVTKQKKEHYEMSKQLDNFKQMLDAMGHDIRAILLKLSDRLHNMRTLASMTAEKQMKIAGETDYFYAPLATRLGLYNIKTELENLSLRFRCPHEYAELTDLIEKDREFQQERLARFREQIYEHLRAHGVTARVFTDYRQPYSLWRKMQKYDADFNHLKYRHYTEVVFDTPDEMSEKEMTLRIYSLLTDHFREKPGGILNYIDSPKENGYQSFHLKLLADFGRWQEVHISSERMMRESQFGWMVVTDKNRLNVHGWMDKFRDVMRDMRLTQPDANDFIENIVASFYNDDIMVFTPKGKPIILPQRSTALDFAYEIHTDLGEHAHYARINSHLASVKTPLHRGDIVEIFPSEEACPDKSWLRHSITYKARRAITTWLSKQPKPKFLRCPVCHPIPGEEVIGYSDTNGSTMVHKRDCAMAIKLASQYGDNIKSVDFDVDGTLYPVKISVRAVDRFHLFIDLVSCITDRLKLSLKSFDTETLDGLVNCHISFAVHSHSELQHIIEHISAINGVDEVKRIIDEA